MFRVIRLAATTPLALLAVVGFVLMPPGPPRPRVRLLFGILLAASALGLVRLHATGGYCTARHALVPGILLTLAGAHGLCRLMERATIPSLGSIAAPAERLRPGPAVWAAVLLLLVAVPRLGQTGETIPGPFHVYRDTGQWLAANAVPGDRILDLTDWSLYFSGLPGYRFAQVYDAPSDPDLRWVVIRQAHLEGRWNYSSLVHNLVQGCEPVALVPPDPGPGQLQVRIYDRRRRGSMLTSAKPYPSREAGLVRK
jgi:hypothetical protein